MTTLYYCPAVHYGETTFWLPPFLEIEETRSQRVDLVSLPNVDAAVITDIRANQGARLSLRVTYIPDNMTTAEVLSIIEQIWAALAGREFTLRVWSDRAWASCALSSMSTKVGLDPLVVLDGAPLEIISASSAPSLDLQYTFSDYATEYPYAADVGRPLGNAASGSTAMANSLAPYSGAFHGVVDAETAVGKDQAHYVGGASGSRWRLIGVQIISAENWIADAITQVKASTVPKGTAGGQAITASVAAAAIYGAKATGSIEFTAGQRIYVHIPTGGAGNHTNVQYRLDLQPI